MRRIAIMRALALAALILQGTLLLRPLYLFPIRPFFEDSFYSLTVSAWLADGKGMTVDGTRPTNGVQPLICYLYVPGFLLVGGDRLAALVPAMTLQSLLFAAAVCGIAAFAASLVRDPSRRRDVFWLFAMLVSWSIPLLNHMLNGLETGLAVACTFTIATVYNHYRARNERRKAAWILLGALMGVGVLARIDLAFLVASTAIVHVLTTKGATRSRRMAEAVPMVAAAALVSLPWWIYNVEVFGSLMPISGQAQMVLNTDRWLNISTALMFMADSFIITTHVPYVALLQYPWIGPTVLAVAVFVVLLLGKSLSAFRSAVSEYLSVWDLKPVIPVLIHVSLLVGYYSLEFGSPHFISRYILPWRILFSMLVTTFLYVLYQRATRRARVGFALMVVAAMAVTVEGFSWNFTGRNGSIYHVRSDWINAHVPPTARVAMFQSGTAGYLSRNVVNLDGKVNFEALRATRTFGIGTYIASSRFEYVMDWPEMITPVMDRSPLRTMYERIDSLADRTLVFKLKSETVVRN